VTPAELIREMAAATRQTCDQSLREHEKVERDAIDVQTLVVELHAASDRPSRRRPVAPRAQVRGSGTGTFTGTVVKLRAKTWATVDLHPCRYARGGKNATPMVSAEIIPSTSTETVLIAPRCSRKPVPCGRSDPPDWPHDPAILQ
jgi:hypothetical protein